MYRRIAPLFGALLAAVLVVGCQTKDQNANTGRQDGGTMAASADACDHCQGVQMMTTDGRCPQCSMKVDDCPHCAGMQKAAAGKCPSCARAVGDMQAPGGSGPAMKSPPTTRPANTPS